MKNKASLGVMSLAMMSVVGIFTLRTLPLMAEYGLSAIFYYVLAALLFFIPSALMCAELATGWPKTGGMYIWVREALGARFGFLAIWLEWTNTVISFPATLAFIAATFSYVISPSLANNKYYMFSLMLMMFWGTTLINFLGIKLSSWFSNIGLIFGTLLPCLLIIVLSIGWIFSSHMIQISLSWRALIPNFSMSNSTFLVGLLLGYAGMQIAGFHAQDVKNPQRDYPKAIFLAVIMILFLSIFGSLAISIVVPTQTISLVAGLMQAAEVFFSTFHMTWFIPVIAVLTAIGSLAMLNMWIIGPSKGILATAQYGDLPEVLKYTNSKGAPTTILLLQAIVGTLFSLVYLFMPSVNSSYWILVAMSAMLTLIMYVLMFTSVIVLRYTQPDIKRAYKIPGGKLGVWLVGGTGITVCSVAFFLGFTPPAQLNTGHVGFYEGFLMISILLISVIPFIKPVMVKSQ